MQIFMKKQQNSASLKQKRCALHARSNWHLNFFPSTDKMTIKTYFSFCDSDSPTILNPEAVNAGRSIHYVFSAVILITARMDSRIQWRHLFLLILVLVDQWFHSFVHDFRIAYVTELIDVILVEKADSMCEVWVAEANPIGQRGFTFVSIRCIVFTSLNEWGFKYLKEGFKIWWSNEKSNWTLYLESTDWTWTFFNFHFIFDWWFLSSFFSYNLVREFNFKMFLF